MPSSRIPVAILGATGLVGQRLVVRLADHPWFELVAVAASGRSAGRPYAEAVEWKLPGAVPESVADLVVVNTDPGGVRAPLVLSALDASVAGEIEDAFAATGRAVVSNARNHRMAPDVPLVVPEINADHLALVAAQQARRGGEGFIVTNPNCSTIALVLALAPLHAAARVRRAVVSTMQASSGAGYPGVPSLDLIDNMIPYIGGEQDKVETEPRKILGSCDGARVEFAPVVVSAQVHRVPVLDGHMISVNLETEWTLTPDDACALLAAFRGEPQEKQLPSAPEQPIVVDMRKDRPQPRLDRDAGRGMAIVVGQVRPCPVLGLHLEVLGHNTERGAAGGTLLVAELLAGRGLVPGYPGGAGAGPRR
jgi:aspartate-semialdehyde dehydrogenase